MCVCMLGTKSSEQDTTYVVTRYHRNICTTLQLMAQVPPLKPTPFDGKREIALTKSSGHATKHTDICIFQGVGVI